MENGNQHSQQPTTSPCIYVACLASYSSGILHGVWIAADQDPADIYAEIRSMLAKSREPFAEEFGIHDYQGFLGYRIDEYEPIENVADIATLIVEHGELGAKLLSQCDSVADARQAMIDDYQGAFDSPTDWAEQFLEETGELAEVPEQLRPYFDFESYARDAELSGDIFIVETGHQHHVFWSR
jgi:antirestriction protein